MIDNRKRSKIIKIKFVSLNLTFYICSIQLAPEGVAGIFIKKGVYQTYLSVSNLANS